VRALFYGLGSDGTVGANKNSIKIIGDQTPNFAQGYFVYDSKKSGSMTTSHLRFGPKPIRSTYLITRASFVACHNFSFLEKMDVLEAAMPGAVFLLNSPYSAAEVWDKLPKTTQEEMLRKKIEFYVIDGYEVARKAGMGTRINTIMQTCFFAISGVLPRDEAIEQIKKAIYKTYGKRGEAVVAKNYAAVDACAGASGKGEAAGGGFVQLRSDSSHLGHAPKFVRDVLGQIAAGHGDLLPVSAIPAGGAFPTGTAQWEKRNIAQFIPVWDKDLCIQCGKCVMVCPHAVIRAKVYSQELGDKAPATFQWAKPKWKGMEQDRYTLQVAPEDCTGCAVCVDVCPVKSKSDASKKAINMAPQAPLREAERANWEFFLGLPEVDRSKLSHGQVKDLQLLQPLFEFSGACAGCGETPYIKLLTQLFGDRLYIANATGCSSIYGGNLPTTPYASNAQGRGPTWANSLFEDNAEFGFGMRIALDQQKEFAETAGDAAGGAIGEELVKALLGASQKTETEMNQQRERVMALREKLAGNKSSDARNLLAIADTLVRKSVWILGGDGWAFDIGFGGLDHVLGSGKNVNVLVLDTEVYSNTGGQMSKATPRGAVAKFAASGKPTAERPGHGSRQLRLGVRGAGGAGRQRHPCGEGLPGGRGARRAVDHHRLLQLHCPRLRPGAWAGAAETGCAVGLLAADALQPGIARGGQESLPARLQGAFDPAQGVQLPRGALHYAGAQQSGAGGRSCSRKRRTMWSASGAYTRRGRDAGPRRDAEHRSRGEA
jgi:pyruvate-ferredoxin/flavodoxin oxidoreductase